MAFEVTNFLFRIPRTTDYDDSTTVRLFRIGRTAYSKLVNLGKKIYARIVSIDMSRLYFVHF